MTDRKHSPGSPWGTDARDEDTEETFHKLTREEAAAWRARNPMVSPWRVVAVQGAVGLVVAMLAWLLTRRVDVFGSALYGAATAVIPGALMARGMTSPLSAMSPVVSTVSVMGWGSVKLIVSVALLGVAPKVVQPLSWPALLAALAACLMVYGFALRWHARKGG
jgi:ATP synthase protein I